MGGGFSGRNLIEFHLEYIPRFFIDNPIKSYFTICPESFGFWSEEQSSLEIPAIVGVKEKSGAYFRSRRATSAVSDTTGSSGFSGSVSQFQSLSTFPENTFFS